jgi:hypothetical protein
VNLRTPDDEAASCAFGRWPRGGEWWLGVFLALFAATSLCFPSSEIFSRRSHRDEAVQHQLAIATHVPMQIDGHPSDISEYRSRVLVPFALLTLKRWHVLKSDVDRFMALRLVSAVVFFFVAFVFAFRVVRGAVVEALAFTGLLAIWLVISFNAAWEIPTEFPELTFLMFATWAAIAGHRVALLLVTVVAALNRESAMYYSVLWGALWAFERGTVRLREAAFAGLVGLVAFAGTVILRTQLRLQDGDLANHVMVGKNIQATIRALAALPSPTWLVPLVTGTAGLVTLIVMSWSRLDRVSRALVSTAAVISLPSFVFANIGELRVFLPSVVIAVAAILRQPSSKHTDA